MYAHDGYNISLELQVFKNSVLLKPRSTKPSAPEHLSKYSIRNVMWNGEMVKWFDQILHLEPGAQLTKLLLLDYSCQLLLCSARGSVWNRGVIGGWIHSFIFIHFYSFINHHPPFTFPFSIYGTFPAIYFGLFRISTLIFYGAPFEHIYCTMTTKSRDDAPNLLT